jgi:tetratricopeptide (TPR) repeat protein
VTYERERVEAKKLVADLLRQPERQALLIRNDRRFHTWGVLELLLELCLQRIPCKPQAGEELAHLALQIAEHLEVSHYGAEAIEDLKARAWAFIGNARRVTFDLNGAEEAFERSRVHLRQGTREPWELAVWLDLKASLFRAQRRFDDARRLLNRALILFLAVGDRHRAGRILVSMDNVLHRAGHPEKGIPLLYKALKLIDPTQEPDLLLIAQHNLLDDLAEVGRLMEAQRLLVRIRSLYRDSDLPGLCNRRRWVEAKIARGLGQPGRAEELLIKAREGFLAQSAPYEVALVSLELAGLFAEQGRITELKQLAQEMAPVFSSRQIHREALAALTLWRQAVEAETASAELAARVARVIKQGRYEKSASGRKPRSPWPSL